MNHEAAPVSASETQRIRRRQGTEHTWFVHGCMHCREHPCMDACPKSCFFVDRETGTVQLDNSGCVGCRRCAQACPYEAIRQNEKRASKCDGCLRRLRRGQLPLCVQACPRKALTVNEKNRVVADGLAALRGELEAFRRGVSTI